MKIILDFTACGRGMNPRFGGPYCLHSISLQRASVASYCYIVPRSPILLSLMMDIIFFGSVLRLSLTANEVPS
jgi:hypothetical protein